MSDFHTAHTRAVSRVGKEAWDLMSLHEQATMFYQELRAFDAERFPPHRTAKAQPPDDGTEG
jgi:hypothetical protein